MSNNRTNMALGQLVRVLREHEDKTYTDGQLLTRFLAQRDEEAFAALVRRHGTMVLSVCRRILGNAADADDAFQTTFLVLVRKARSLKSRSVLGDWLHGVAKRSALKARASAKRRRAKEQAMARSESPGAEPRDDWLPILDEELSRLPEKYRLPIILCDLEGRTRQEAAHQLKWPEGTVAGRLARARELLAKRLTRRGVSLPAAGLAAALPATAVAGVSPSIAANTIKAACLLAAGQAALKGVVSVQVTTLTGEVMKGMLLSKLKYVAIALVTCVFLAGSWVGYSTTRQAGAVQPFSGDGRSALPEAKVAEALANEPFAQEQAEEVADFRPIGRVPGYELIWALQTQLEMRTYHNVTNLKETLELLSVDYAKASKGKWLRLLVDVNAFKEIEPKEDPYNRPIRMPPVLFQLTVAQFLTLIVAQMPNESGAVLLRDGLVIITTKQRASVPYLLQEKVLASFENVPFADAIQRLSDLTGVSINIDPRAGDKAKTPITAVFRNDVTLGAALRTLADMVGLKMVDMQSGLYVTTPENAKELEKELKK